MKRCLYALFFLSSLIHAQERDTRAEIEIRGGIAGIAISPDEKIWLMGRIGGIGKMYFAENIYADWHDYGKDQLFKGSGNTNKHADNITRLLFFNNDTAIATGQNVTCENSVLYWTGDGGKHWQKQSNPDCGFACLFSAKCADKEGHAWIVDWSGQIFVSKDFGLTWVSTDTSSYCTSISSLYMADAGEGIGCGRNIIYATSDNWKSRHIVTTPFDQKKYNEGTWLVPSVPGGFMYKAELWGKYIVVNQAGHIFYSEKDHINWKTFPVEIIDFEMDNSAGRLFAITKSLNIILFSDPGKYSVVCRKQLADYYSYNLTVVNHSLYVLDSDATLYKINMDTFFSTEPYTTDYKIKPPTIVKCVGGSCVGIEAWRNTLYRSDNGGVDWYREKVLGFNIRDIPMLNDTSAMLWDGDKEYLYSFTTHASTEYIPNRPFDSFLKYPVRKLTMQVDGLVALNDRIVYTRQANTDSFSVSVEKHKAKRGQPYIEDTTNRDKIVIDTLVARLKDINNDPLAVPSINDFHITGADKKRYLKLMKKPLIEKGIYQPLMGRRISKEKYKSVVRHLDTITNATIKQSLDFWEGGVNYSFRVEIINENNDTVKLDNANEDYCIPYAWNLPWVCSCHQNIFKCYDIGLSRFIKYCKPPGDHVDEIFDNSLLLLRIADYLDNSSTMDDLH